MIKISAKIMTNHRCVKSLNYINVEPYESDKFYFYMTEICKRLDISTPIIINFTKNSYEEFNFVKFKKDDFIDKIDFDYLLIENIDR
jgi:hypothetical protein